MVDENHYEDDESIDEVRAVLARPPDFVTEAPAPHQGRTLYFDMSTFSTTVQEQHRIVQLTRS